MDGDSHAFSETTTCLGRGELLLRKEGLGLYHSFSLPLRGESSAAVLAVQVESLGVRVESSWTGNEAGGQPQNPKV